MKVFFGNFAFLFGIIGFLFYLFLIIAGFIGCCSSMTMEIFNKITLATLGVAVLVFIVCMYNNCCKLRNK